MIGQATADQVAAWKKSHKLGIYGVVTNGHIAYFRKPTRHDVNAALAEASNEKPLNVGEKFAELTFIGGSDAVLTDDALFLSAVKAIRSQMEGKEAEQVNL